MIPVEIKIDDDCNNIVEVEEQRAQDSCSLFLASTLSSEREKKRII